MSMIRQRTASQIRPPGNNRLTSSVIGSVTEKYAYDYDGNISGITYMPTMRWDFKDQLQATSTQVVNNGGTPVTTYYVYNSSGQRMLKFTQSAAAGGQAGVVSSARIYLGNYEVYRDYTSDTTIQTVHIMDDKRRVAMVETETSATSPVSVTRYQFNNHLGSAILELDDNAKIISYEEYYPYGSTSYQAANSTIEVSSKRYRYTGKERDEESGFYYYGARYFGSWLGRWTSPDPGGFVDGINLYAYGRGNPLRYKDETGLESGPATLACVDPTAPMPRERRGKADSK